MMFRVCVYTILAESNLPTYLGMHQFNIYSYSSTSDPGKLSQCDYTICRYDPKFLNLSPKGLCSFSCRYSIPYRNSFIFLLIPLTINTPPHPPSYAFFFGLSKFLSSPVHLECIYSEYSIQISSFFLLHFKHNIYDKY